MRKMRAKQTPTAGNAAGISDMARCLAAARSPREIIEFLDGILTPRERASIALRWKLVKMLQQGTSQRRISDALGISLCKITRGSRELKRGPLGFRNIVRKAVAKERNGSGPRHV